MRPPRIIILWGVLYLLSAAPAPGQFDAEAPEPIGSVKGTLIVAGGGTLPDPIYEAFLQRAGGAEARLVVIPTASSKASATAGERFTQPWRERGFAQVSLLHTRSRDRADQDEFAAPLRDATAVWLSGGVQSRISSAYVGTQVERELHRLLDRGGVIGGASAGAAVMSRVMISGGAEVARVEQGFDLVPGAVVDQHFSERERESRLWGVLDSRPGLVGIGVDEGTAMVLRGRRLFALGRGAVHVYLNAGSQKPRVVKELREGDRRRNRADLIALHRDAVARSLPAFPPEQPPVPRVESGTLMIVGGGGLPDGLMEQFLELAGGPDAPIIYVPCTEELEITRPPSMLRYLENAGATDVAVFHTKDRSKADQDEEFLAPLRRAQGIWFGGGRQWNLVDSYQHTEAHRLMEQVLERGGVIGGSSAGASIQADYLCRGDPLQNTNIIAPGYETGLGFLRGVGIDQHFFRRGRPPDMTELMSVHPQLLGIGIDEGTALIVKGTRAEIVGNSKVAFYDRNKPVQEGRPDYEVVEAGQVYDLVERQVLEGGKMP